MTPLEKGIAEHSGTPIYTWPNVSECMHEIMRNAGALEPEPPKPNLFQRLGSRVLGMVR